MIGGMRSGLLDDNGRTLATLDRIRYYRSCSISNMRLGCTIPVLGGCPRCMGDVDVAILVPYQCIFRGIVFAIRQFSEVGSPIFLVPSYEPRRAGPRLVQTRILATQHPSRIQHQPALNPPIGGTQSQPRGSSNVVYPPFLGSIVSRAPFPSLEFPSSMGTTALPQQFSCD